MSSFFKRRSSLGQNMTAFLKNTVVYKENLGCRIIQHLFCINIQLIECLVLDM